MKMNGAASLPAWFYCLLALMFLGMNLEHIAEAWEWVRSGVDSEEQALMYPDLTEIRKKAEEGDAKALSTMGDAYHFGEGGMPQSDSIAMQYYVKSYEKAIEQGDLETSRGVASALYMMGGAESEKWQKRHEEAIAKIENLEKAKRQKLIDEHEAMIPQ